MIMQRTDNRKSLDEICGILSRDFEFEKICSQENADKLYRNFTARGQFYAMMIAQLTNQKGLRSIGNAIASDNDLYHAGIRANITRTNLAQANENGRAIFFKNSIFIFSTTTSFCGEKENEKKKKI